MTIDFPNAPQTNDTYTFGDRQWIWNGSYWQSSGFVIGYTGSAGTDGVVVAEISPTPPSTPSLGNVWIDSTTGIQYFYVNDGDSSQWVEFSNPGEFAALGYTGSQGLIGYTGSQGSIGYTGSAGAAGGNGSVGFTGSAGTGFTGSQGLIGYTGSSGTESGMQYYVTNSNIVGVNSTAAQDILGVGVTLSANTFYEFEGNFNFFKNAGNNSHIFRFQWGGTATFGRIVTNMLVQASAQGFVTRDVARDVRHYTLESVGPFAVNDAVTNNFYTVNLQVRGIVKVANGGTLIPQYSLSAAPGGAYTASESNNMSIWPLGPSNNNNISIGSWA